MPYLIKSFIKMGRIKKGVNLKRLIKSGGQVIMFASEKVGKAAEEVLEGNV
jgi:hypothetical protein